MKQSLLVTTAVAILTGTGALAQAPSDRTQASNERSTVPSAAQSQSKQNPPAALAPVPPSSAGSTSTTQNAPSARLTFGRKPQPASRRRSRTSIAMRSDRRLNPASPLRHQTRQQCDDGPLTSPNRTAAGFFLAGADRYGAPNK
jgi:hypothetical protein